MDAEFIKILQNLVIQFPLVVLFIIYSERKEKQFRDFMREQRKEYFQILLTISDKLENHHDEMMKAIKVMDERTRPRDKL